MGKKIALDCCYTTLKFNINIDDEEFADILEREFSEVMVRNQVDIRQITSMYIKKRYELFENERLMRGLIRDIDRTLNKKR